MDTSSVRNDISGVGGTETVHNNAPGDIARLEARIAIRDWLERFQSLELTTDQPLEPRPALHVHGPARLPIRFEVRGHGDGQAQDPH